MVRLNVPKSERVAKKRSMLGMSSQLSSITHFSDITALTGGAGRQVREINHFNSAGGRQREIELTNLQLDKYGPYWRV